MPQAPAPSRLVTVLLYITWISIVGMVISAVAALATGLGKGNGWPQLIIALGFAILGVGSMVASAFGNVRGRQSMVKPLAYLVLAALLVWLLLAIICERALEGSNRVPCASNLRQIGQAIQLYADEHGGVCPPKFEDLITTTDLDPAVFICPYTHDRPADPKKPLAPQFAQSGHCSYRYLTPGVRLADLSADTPMATEDPANHDNDGANVLFGDGHVEWLTATACRQLLTATRPTSRSQESPMER